MTGSECCLVLLGLLVVAYPATAPWYLCVQRLSNFGKPSCTQYVTVSRWQACYVTHFTHPSLQDERLGHWCPEGESHLAECIRAEGPSGRS
jgi:hypothetical protein